MWQWCNHTCSKLNIISIANTSVWGTERIRNAHTHTDTLSSRWMTRTRFFFLSLFLFFLLALPFPLLFLSLLLWPGEFDWQTHAHWRKENERRLLWLYPTVRAMLVSLVWLRLAYLMFYLIYSRWIFYTIYVKRDKEDKKKKRMTETKKKDRNGMRKAIKSCSLAWKMLLIDVILFFFKSVTKAKRKCLVWNNSMMRRKVVFTGRQMSWHARNEII